MILSLIGGGSVRITEETAAKLDPVITRERPPSGIKFPDAGGVAVTIKTAQITGLWTDEQWADQVHERAGDLRCAFGFWHGRREPCGHTPPPPPPSANLDYLREGRDPTGQRTEYQDKFAAMIAFNLAWAKAHPLPTGGGEYGHFRTVEEWDLYQARNVMPEKPERKRTKWMALPDASPFPGTKAKMRLVEVAIDSG